MLKVDKQSKTVTEANEVLVLSIFFSKLYPPLGANDTNNATKYSLNSYICSSKYHIAYKMLVSYLKNRD